MNLFPYQQEGAEWLPTRDTALLGYEPGLGKTITSIAAADRLGVKNILVLCQAVGKTHWKNEFTRFQQIDRSITIINGHTQPVPETGVVIVNYDLISRADSMVTRALLRREWDVLIADEAHALKSPKSNRTRAVYGKRLDRTKGLAAQAQRVWLLTGTPAPNSAHELYTHLRALAPEAIELIGRPMSEPEFVERFCTYRDTTFGRQITGSKNLTELRQRMQNFMLRKRKTEVLQDLPPLSFDTLVVHPHDVPGVPASLVREMSSLDMQLAMDWGVDGEGDDLLAVLSAMKASEHIATQRRLTGQIKAEIAIDLVTSELRGSDKKMILFCHHTAVIDRIVEGLADAGFGVVKIDGRDNQASRDNAIDAFQRDQATQVFVGQLTAAGTSITLTAASDVLFVEASWVPSENYQAACRAHRIGQKDGVLARFLTLEGSLDKQIMTTLARKARDIAVLIDAEGEQQ